MARIIQDLTLTLVLALQNLFPPHPLAHNRLLRLEGSKKLAPVTERAARPADYARHLAVASFDSEGALGMFPGVSVPDARGSARWYMGYLAVDFDGHLPEQVVPLATTLEGFGFAAYLTCGTSGRGTHLYVFFAKPLPQWQVYAVLKGVQAMAEGAGFGTPEIRPSCRAGRGSPIFLPYRGGP